MMAPMSIIAGFTNSSLYYITVKMATGRIHQKLSSVNAIYFDLDNTLIKTRKGDKLACEKVLYF